MNKTTVSITLDPEKWTRFKTKVGKGNASNKIEKFIENVIEMEFESPDGIEEIEDEIREIQEKKQKLSSELIEKEQKISSLETKIESLMAKKEEKENEINSFEVNQ